VKKAQTLSPEKFHQQFQKFANKEAGLLSRAVLKGVVVEVHSGIVLRNPVLSGLSRNNWVMTLETPHVGSVDEVAGVSLTGAPLTRREKSRQKDLIRAIDGAQDLPSKVWITNNLHYISRLEAGWSSKAPAGMVGLAISSVSMGGVKLQVRAVVR
jgi:hypothetical protein